jgi:hypothetical protein
MHSSILPNVNILSMQLIQGYLSIVLIEEDDESRGKLSSLFTNLTFFFLFGICLYFFSILFCTAGYDDAKN